MQFETNFENKPLLEKKLELLNNILVNFCEQKKTLKNEVKTSYHEEEISFFTSNNKLEKDFAKVLPASWLQPSRKRTHSIYIFNPEDYGFTISDWQFETSQDCFLDSTQKSALQRDFISHELNDQETILICHNSMDDGLNNFLRWFLPRRLLKKGTLVFHSSCVIENGQAKVFLGHSGAGKSTMVSLREGREHLSDDMNLITIENDKIFIQAGAIGGLFFDKVDYSKKYPVSSFSWLVQDSLFSSQKLTPTKAYTRALASVSNIFWDTLEVSETNKVMKLVKSITAACPFYSLHFKKDPEVWKYVE
ncbi:hypothetical protein [Halobacteriovorax sp. HLS]|uniref:hypothetical protein n=1 Tax=Halobacteriovorax sp. HLS TaxID=2234000 RepID=UPI000FDBFEDB|nr:hypothetical protein [Halobacteriovorax sp. HLS]